MPRSSHIASLLSALALVFPGAALAQGSASGDTYQDPFPNQPRDKTGGHHGGGSGRSSNTQGTSTGGTSGRTSSGSGSGSSPTATTASTSSSGQSGSSGSSASSSGSNGKLPRTGLDASIFALVGAVLIASGVAIRRRIPAFWR